MQDAACESTLLTRDREKSAGGEDKASEAIALRNQCKICRHAQNLLSTRAPFFLHSCLQKLQVIQVPSFLKVSHSHMHGCAGTFVEQGEGGRDRDLHGP